MDKQMHMKTNILVRKCILCFASSVSQSFFDYDETEHSRQIIAKSNLGNGGSDMVLLGQDAALTCMKYSSNSL